VAAHRVDVNGGTVLREGFFFGDSAAVPRLSWEDFAVGYRFEHGPRRLPRDEMVGFAAEFDPQPMHLDEVAARESMLGGLAASGWYASAIMMRMAFDAFIQDSSSMGAPGVDEVKWLRPIRPDDEVLFRATVLETRASRSRPDMGLVKFRFELIDGRGGCAMTLLTSLMMGRRQAAAARAAPAANAGPAPAGPVSAGPAPAGPRVVKFLEDIVVGERIALGSHTFTADDIKAFARRFDPQPFHLDEAAAARSHFGALCASGWHTAATWMRLMLQHQRIEDAAMRARGEPVAALGPSPGFHELKWLRPVYAGDTVHYATEVLGKRESNSRRGWGLISIRNTGINQNGEPVLSFLSAAFVERRGGRNPKTA